MDAVGLFGAEQVARAWRYHKPLYASAVAQLALAYLLLVLIVFGPLGDWLFEPLEGWPWWAQVVGLTALLDALTLMVGLPISFWTGFVHERSWGFSTQDLGSYAADRAKGFVLGLALSGAALVGLVGSARLLPRGWPLPAAAAGAAIVLALAASIRSPSAASFASRNLEIAFCANGSYATSASGSPRHSPNAEDNCSLARPASP